jgi:hypothetical protein
MRRFGSLALPTFEDEDDDEDDYDMTSPHEILR